MSWHGWVGVPLTGFWSVLVQIAGWLVAAAWCAKTYGAFRGIPTVADLTSAAWDVAPVRAASLTVVVPAKDEAENVAATCEALLLADYSQLRILAVDDRSTDATGTILDEFAARNRDRLNVIHVIELPEGWLGKTHALSVATDNSDTEWLLFTDADVVFSPSILRCAMAYAEASEADHLVVLPTMQVRSPGEGIVLGFFQIFGLWASRPWRVADVNSPRDLVGVGAFNMIRRDALKAIGGWAPQRLAVLEDITLGRRVKAAGLRQRIAFAPGMVTVHWAKGFRGLMRVMTKNMFSAFNFQPLLLLGMCLWTTVFCLAPLVGLAWRGTFVPSLFVLCCIGAAYRVMGRVSLIDARYGWLYPLGALAFIWAMLKSMATVWVQRGVVWRGTHYALGDLRKHNSPFVWEREATKMREERRRKTSL